MNSSLKLTLSNSNLYYLNLSVIRTDSKSSSILEILETLRNYFLLIESLCNSNKTLSPLEFELERVNCIIKHNLSAHDNVSKNDDEKTDVSIVILLFFLLLFSAYMENLEKSLQLYPYFLVLFWAIHDNTRLDCYKFSNITLQESELQTSLGAGLFWNLREAEA